MSQVNNENQKTEDGNEQIEMAYNKVPVESQGNLPKGHKEDLNDSDVGSVHGDADEEIKKKLMFGEKDISLVQLLTHLSEGFDYFLMIIGFIGAVGSGVAFPIIAYLSGDMFSEVGGDAEQNIGNMSNADVIKLMNKVEDALMEQVNYLYITNFRFINFYG